MDIIKRLQNEKIYNELRKKYTDEEIVDSMLIPADLIEEEQEELASEMREIRMKNLRETTQIQQVMSHAMQRRFQNESQLKKCLKS